MKKYLAGKSVSKFFKLENWCKKLALVKNSKRQNYCQKFPNQKIGVKELNVRKKFQVRKCALKNIVVYKKTLSSNY